MTRGALTNDAAGLATFYNAMYAARGMSLPPHLLDPCRALMDDRIPKLAIILGPGAGKALHPDTKILTIRGWIAIREARVGDEVILPDGATTARIQGVFHQPRSSLYKLTFKDGRQILANKDHLWKAYNKKFDLKDKRDPQLKWRIRTTEEIELYSRRSRNLRWYIPLVEPIQFSAKQFPIHPYVLGCILGDGDTSPKTGFCGLTTVDSAVIERIVRLQADVGLDVSKHASKIHYGLKGLGTAITQLGLKGQRSWEKFIPDIYKQGSIEQRYDLLQGLMDTDGYAGKNCNTVFTSTSLQLAKDVQALVWSLGGIAQISTKNSSYMHNKVKRAGRAAYNVSIRHADAARMFYLPRKKERAYKTQYAADLKLEILKIEVVDAAESICINIDHPDGLFIAENFIVTHNSQLITTAYPAFRIGMDPTMTCLAVSAGEALVQGFVHAAMEWVEHDPMWKLFFPKVAPDKAAGWSKEAGMFVTGRLPGDPDASYIGVGLTSKRLTGLHARLNIWDDLHDKENSTSEDSCKKVSDMLYSTLYGRGDPRGARYLLVGRRFHQADTYAHVKGQGDWVVMELQALRKGTELFWDVFVPDGLLCCFTEPVKTGIIMS